MKLKELRKQKKLTQNDLANVLKISKSTYSGYETGYSTPNTKKLEVLSEFYGVSVDCLLGREESTVLSDFSSKYESKQIDPSLGVPLFEAGSDFLSNTDFNAPVDPKGYISIPNVPKCDGAYTLIGSNLPDSYQAGDIILYKKLTDLNNQLFFGEMYLIELQINGDSQIMVKYINESEKGDDHLQVSSSKTGTTKDIEANKLVTIASIKASIRFN